MKTATSVLPAHGEKRVFVRSLFDRIAPRYDLVNRVMTFGLDQRWRRRLLRDLSVGPGDRVLDLATGTGDLAGLARRCGARTTGVDLSHGMLRAARRRDPAQESAQADAVALPLRTASVDVITCGFALRNFSDLDGVLAECARVLAPGGRLGLVEVDAPRSKWLRAGHALHFRRLVPRIGALLSDAEAYRYLPESTEYLPEAADLCARIERAGFENVCKRALALGAVQTLVAARGLAS